MSDYLAQMQAEQAKDRKVLTMVAVGVFGVVVAGFIGFKFFYVPPFDYGKHAAALERLEDDLKAEPCNLGVAVKFSEKLNTAGDHPRVLVENKRFFDACGPSPRLLWTSYTAHKRMGAYDAAIDVATDLIASDPDDQDFFWWRGRVHRMKGDLEKAANDFMVCQHLLPKASSCPFDLAQALEDLGRPCEAMTAVLRSVDVRPEWETNPKVQSRLARLDGKGNCTTRPVKQVLKPKVREEGFVVDVTLNGLAKEMVLDDGALRLELSRKDADAAGVVVQKVDGLSLRTDDGHRAQLGLVSTVNAGGFVAKDVEVAVVDADVPPRLGRSFLNRFNLEFDFDDKVLRPIQR